MMLVAVIAYNRPKYLYVTLDSIFRNKSIDKVDVNVYIDGGCDCLQEMLSGISEFDVRGIHINKGQLYGFRNTVFALRDCFDNLRYNRCFFIEDDHIVRSDCIDYCLNKDDGEAFISLCGAISKDHGYRSRGNLIFDHSFYKLDKWLRDYGWVGKLRTGCRPEEQKILTVDETAVDNVFYAYTYYTGAYTEYAGKYYAAHFGLRPDPDDKEYNDLIGKMFSGDKKDWIYNISSIITEGTYSDRFGSYLYPRKAFVYE